MCCLKLDTFEYTLAHTGQLRGVKQFALLMLVFDLELFGDVSDCEVLPDVISIVALSIQASSSKKYGMIYNDFKEKTQ